MKTLSPLYFLIHWGILVLVSGIGNELASQNPKLSDKAQFQTIVVPGGNKTNMVGRIHQDKMGFLWLPTQEGLFRFDGINFKQFLLANKDSRGAKANSIEKVHIDADGIYWVGSASKGLYRFDPISGTFQQFRLRKNDATGWPSDYIIDIDDGPDGRIWMTTQAGIMAFDKEKETFEVYEYAFVGNKKYIFNHLEEVLFDRSGNLWFGAGEIWKKNYTNSDALFRYLPGSNSFEAFTPDYSHNRSFRPICLYEDISGGIWIGTYDNELFKFDPNTLKFQEYPFEPSTQSNLERNHSIVSSITRDCYGRLWITVLNKGLYCYEPWSGTYELYRTDSKGPNSLHDIGAGKLFTTIDGTIWIAGGKKSAYLQKLEVCSNQTSLIQTKPQLVNYQTTSFAEASNGHIWVGTEKNGLFLIDSMNQILKHFEYDSIGHQGLSSNNIKSLLLTQDSNLWIGYWPNGIGLDRLDLINERFSTLSHDPQITNSLSGNAVMDLMEDSHGFIWIATWGAGVNKYDPNTKKFTRYFHASNDTNSLGGNYVLSLYEDKSKNIWIGGGGTLLEPFQPIFLDRFENGRFHHYHSHLQGTIFPNVDGITDLTEDDQGNLWLSKRGALARISLNNETADIFHFNDEKENYRWFWQLEMDNIGGVWSTGLEGVYRLNPEEKKFDLYPWDQFQVRSNWWQPLSKVRGSQYLIGGQGGYIQFNINELQKKITSQLPPINILEINVSGMPIENYEPKGVSISEIGQFSMSQNKSSFSIQLASIWFQNENPFNFEYTLTNYDEGWKPLPPAGLVHYSKIPTGRYQFQVRAHHEWGIPSGSAVNIEIFVLGPWWLRWWAFVIYASLIFGMVSVFYSFQLKRKLAEAEAEKTKELNHQKNRLYTNITHEFRTPLTVISGLTQEIKGNDEKKLLIQKNSDQLLKLINQILSLQKLESHEMELKLKDGDIAVFLNYLTGSFQTLAQQKKIQLHIYADPDNIPMAFDEEKIQQIVSNLIVNALKFTPESGKITLGLSIVNGGTQIQLKVRDTGIGIPAEKLDLVFDRFYQVDDLSENTSQGTGIGLALVKELVNLMNGEIKVQSEVGSGTTFNLKLPFVPLIGVPANDEGQRSLIAPQTDFFYGNQPYPFFEKRQAPLLLIIEDNFDVIFYLKTILSKSFQIKIAHNGTDGCKCALEDIPDIIISDVMVPEMDGFDLCSKLKNDERTNHIPVILITAKSTQEERLHGLRAGADAYLVKPFNKEELIIRLDKLLTLRKEMQAKYREKSSDQLYYKDVFLRKAQKAVEEHIEDENFGTEQLCRIMLMSRSQLYRKMKALLNISTSRFIQQIRLYRAHHLIQTTDKTIGAISSETGFRDPSYFTKLYFAEFRKKPSDTRN